MTPPQPDFWDLIDLGKGASDRLDAALTEMSEGDVVAFHAKHIEYEEQLKKAGLRAFMGQAVAADAVDDLAKWIVDQGLDSFDASIREISGKPPRGPATAQWKTPHQAPPSGTWRDLRKTVAQAYRSRFGTAIRKVDDPADWFWWLVDIARTDNAGYELQLRKLDRAALADLYWDIEEAAAELRQPPYTDHMGADVSEDVADDTALTVVLQGKGAYQKVLDDPALVPKDAEAPAFRGTVRRIYKERFGALPDRR